MSKIKLSPNLFLEVNELNKLISFIDNGYKQVFKNLVKSFGIVQNESNSFFKVTPKLGTSDTVIVNKGLAFDTNMEAIVMDNDIEMIITNTGTTRWLILSRSVTNIEVGSVTLSADGTLTGVNTEFTKVLRGQPNFPTKVRIQNSESTYYEEVEVVKVISDTSAILSGEFNGSPLLNSNCKYSTIGTFTPGFQPKETDKFIYEYDSYNIRIVDSESLPSITSDEFVLCKISFDVSGGMSVSDERSRYMFNNPYTQRTDELIFNNPLCSLISVGMIGNSVNSADFELIIENGYSVSRYEFLTTTTTNTFNIIAGKSNYLGDGDIVDGFFNRWVLLNRANMKYVIIDNNVNKTLFIDNFDTSVIEESGNDFIIIPNFNEIEYEVKVSSNVDKPEIPFYFKKSMNNLNDRIRFHSFLPNSIITTDRITVKIRHRVIDNSGKIYPYSNLAIAQFENVNGQSETLANSSFSINLSDIQPQSKQRNYS